LASLPICEGMTKAEIYKQTAKEIAAVLEGETNNVARMATVSCLLSEAFETYFWTGFYVVDPKKPEELVVGPYQGTLGCLRIPIVVPVYGPDGKLFAVFDVDSSEIGSFDEIDAAGLAPILKDLIV